MIKGFAAGLIAGGILGAAGLTIALRDNRIRKRLARDSKKLMNTAGDAVENITDMF